ncbi:MAG: hypothetical protein HQL17_00435 [Candidatus Omnitrophica bacterium]|nr:hypothetical protein [Candidatus Omnitrophota bacterium]
MRKLMSVVMVMVLGFAMTSAVLAANAEKVAVVKKHEASDSIKGMVSSINAAANQIVIKQDGTDVMTTVTVPAGEVAVLKEGMHVKVMLKAGTTDQATAVKVMTHKKKK